LDFEIHRYVGEGHPLLGRRMPDLDLVTAGGPLRVFALLHDARPVLLTSVSPAASTSLHGRIAFS
jgi:3-(3-hydroxy-phenyl)propionate hydroxylase